MASPSGGSTPPVKAPDRPAPPAPAPEAPSAGNKGSVRDRTLENWFYAEPFAFAFFQSVRLLERLQTSKKTVGRSAAPRDEVVRFRSHLSLNFPPSSIYDLVLPNEKVTVPLMTVAFMGMYGPSGM